MYYKYEKKCIKIYRETTALAVDILHKERITDLFLYSFLFFSMVKKKKAIVRLLEVPYFIDNKDVFKGLPTLKFVIF